MIKVLKHIGIGMLFVVPGTAVAAGLLWAIAYQPVIIGCVTIAAGLIYIAYIIGENYSMHYKVK